MLEFYGSAFRRKLYHSLDELQADVDACMEIYNAERTHTGKYCYGKTPLQTFIESATLAYDKQLARIKPTSETASTMRSLWAPDSKTDRGELTAKAYHGRTE